MTEQDGEEGGAPGETPGDTGDPAPEITVTGPIAAAGEATEPEVMEGPRRRARRERAERRAAQERATAIEQAREAIYLETYIWKADALGERFKEALIRKAQEGVAVYVVFDWFGNVVVPHAFKRFPAPVHTLAYRPIRRPRHLLDPRRYALEHRKLLVVDGETAFLGGYNIGAMYATEWRDTHLRLKGPAARRLARSPRRPAVLALA